MDSGIYDEERNLLLQEHDLITPLVLRFLVLVGWL